MKYKKTTSRRRQPIKIPNDTHNASPKTQGRQLYACIYIYRKENIRGTYPNNWTVKNAIEFNRRKYFLCFL